MDGETNAAEATTSSMSVVTNQCLPLQRARYVHVTDLTSAYNVDNTKLLQELERVQQETKNCRAEEPPPALLADGVPAELDTSDKKRLQPPKGGSNMVVLVGEIRIVVDKKRVDGSRVRLAEVEVGDETGMVSLRARDQQIDALQAISDRGGAVVLRNCSLELYQGKHMRLAVTKWGKLTPYPDNIASTPPPPSKMNRERNFSLIDLTVVASESQSPDAASSGDNHQMYNYSKGSRQHSGGRSHRGGKKHHSRQQIHQSPPMMATMHPHFMDNQQYAASGAAMHYDGRFALPPQHHQYFSPAAPTAGQHMMYGTAMRRTPSSSVYAAPTTPQDPAMFLALQQQQQQQHGSPAYGRQPSPPQDLRNAMPGALHNMNPQAATYDPHMNSQAATYDPSLYSTYRSP